MTILAKLPSPSQVKLIHHYSSISIQVSGDVCNRLAVLRDGLVTHVGAPRHFRRQFCTRIQVRVVTGLPDIVVERCKRSWGDGVVTSNISLDNEVIHN